MSARVHTDRKMHNDSQDVICQRVCTLTTSGHTNSDMPLAGAKQLYNFSPPLPGPNSCIILAPPCRGHQAVESLRAY